jgi:hypothetical protein
MYLTIETQIIQKPNQFIKINYNTPKKVSFTNLGPSSLPKDKAAAASASMLLCIGTFP